MKGSDPKAKVLEAAMQDAQVMDDTEAQIRIAVRIQEWCDDKDREELDGDIIYGSDYKQKE